MRIPSTDHGSYFSVLENQALALPCLLQHNIHHRPAQVVSANYLVPTFANVSAPYPNHPFTILVWGEDLSKFDPKPASWDGKQVCATGQITSYRGKPEIVAKNPGQVTMNQK